MDINKTFHIEIWFNDENSNVQFRYLDSVSDKHLQSDDDFHSSGIPFG